MRGLIEGLPSPHPLGPSLPAVYQDDQALPPDGTAPPRPGFPLGTYTTVVTDQDVSGAPDGEGAAADRDLIGRWVVRVGSDEAPEDATPPSLTFYRDGRRVSGGILVPQGDTILINSTDCAAEGTYRWAFSGDRLRLTTTEDACDRRRIVLTTHPLLRQNLAMRFMSAFDEVLAPIISCLDNIEAYFDPGLAPGDFVDWLSTWVAFSPRGDWPLRHRRAHVALAPRLLRSWGTVEGITALVSIFSGVDRGRVEITENGAVAGSPVPGAEIPGAPEPRLSVRVRVPDPSRIDAERLDRLVSIAKPAHMVHEVEVIAE